MYTIKDKQIVVFGGSGFLGRVVVNRLARGGAYVTVVSRHPERHRELKVLPRLQLVTGDVRDPACVGRILDGQNAAVNLVGVLGGGGRRLQALHVDWPARLVQSGTGLERLVHVSAIGADPDARSQYLASKGEGEARIRTAGIPWTIIAPSVIFGPGDGLFGRFARLFEMVPGVIPVIKPRARFSPVYVADVAAAIGYSLTRPDLAGERLEVGGPETWTLREIMCYTRRLIGVRRLLLNVPDGLASIQAAWMGLLPGEPFSSDQLRTLGAGSVVTDNALERLGVEPTPVSAVVPYYLGDQRRQVVFNRYRHSHSRDVSITLS